MDDVVVLGFDARVPVTQQLSVWTDQRRSDFLIRPEVPSPISVDRDVWPVVSANPDEGYPLFLWGSLREILGTLPGAATRASGAPVIVEIAVVATDEESLQYWEPMMFDFVDTPKDLGSTLASEYLGYDVADRFLISGLSNCKLSEQEMATLRKDWSGALNNWGLFNDVQEAKAFRLLCNHLVPEHAPFEAYRLRQILLSARIRSTNSDCALPCQTTSGAPGLTQAPVPPANN
ncbi:MAG TPA: hypothetical protein VG675_22120 [Bryobacteraceae bacterium]|nr:hypothetical protein [Bryobacteraceae bacterium]